MKTNTTMDRVMVRSLPTGRRDVAARDVLQEVERLIKEDVQGSGAPTPAEYLAQVEARARALSLQSQACSDLERRYAAAQRKPPQSPPNANPRARAPVDVVADRIIAGVEGSASAYLTSFEASDPEYQAAQAFLHQAFPKGVKAITHATFSEQLQQMRTLIDYCRGEGAAHVRALSLSPMIRKLEEILPDYAAMVGSTEDTTVRFPQVEDARRDGHALLRRLVVAILDTPNALPEADAEPLRQRLLAPIDKQEQADADLSRRQSRADATGASDDPAEVPPDGAPTDPPSVA